MYLLRSPQPKDFECFVKLAMKSSFGVSSLPHDRSVLEKKFHRALDSFANERVHKCESVFLFVMEDLKKKAIIGISAVTAHSGIAYPRYYLKLDKDIINHRQKQCPTHDLLRPVIETYGPSELCSLFLNRNYRGKGVGQLLSLARFLFIDAYPEHFADQIMGVSRGFYESDGKTSLFWNHIGRKFYPVDFEKLLKRMQSKPNLIGQFFPQYPIYMNLIPKVAQKLFGKPHLDTVPAYHILKKIGFSFNGIVDFIDGGPKLTADIQKLPLMGRVYKMRYAGPVKKSKCDIHQVIVSNAQFTHFKAMQIEAFIDGSDCYFASIYAKQLQVNKNDPLGVYVFKKEPRPL